jgi:hypothetical protein
MRFEGIKSPLEILILLFSQLRDAWEQKDRVASSGSLYTPFAPLLHSIHTMQILCRCDKDEESKADFLPPSGPVQKKELWQVDRGADRFDM